VSLKTPVQYPIRVTANRTGLSIDTLRAWERRYQAVTPQRGDRGRAYGEEQIQRLILLRNAVARGHAIGQVASLSDAQLQQLLAGPSTSPALPESTGGMSDGLQAVVVSIERFDHVAANSQLCRMAALLPVREFVGEVVIPLMRLVGDRWHNGTMTIAKEHMTSSILRNLLGGMAQFAATTSQPTRILFATPGGELHEFGILVGAMLCMARGCEAVYLGPNLPAQEIVSAVAQTSPRAVVLGIRNSQPSAVEAIQMIATTLPRQTELWLGGSEVKKLAQSVQSDRVFAMEDFDELDLHLDRLKKEDK
jgi:DNA-binding transcriptional MerR regulator